jgi:hypothetical protein
MFGREKEHELPESLRSLNLTPEQILERVRASEASEAAVKAAADATAATEAANSELAKARTDMQALEARATASEAKLAELAPTKEKTKVTPFNEQIWEDPEGAVDGKLAGMAGAVIQTNIQTAKMQVRQYLDDQAPQERASGKTPKIAYWKKFQGEIEEMAKQTPSVQLTSAQMWLNMLDVIIGRHIGEIVSNPGSFALDPSSTGASSNENRSDSANAEVKLTDEDKLNAKRMGVSEAAWLKSKQSFPRQQAAA